MSELEHESGVRAARRVIEGLTFEDPAVREAVRVLLRTLENVHGSVEAAHMNIGDLESPPRNLPGQSDVQSMVYNELDDTGWDGDLAVPEGERNSRIQSALLRIVQRLARELDDARAELREALRDRDLHHHNPDTPIG